MLKIKQELKGRDQGFVEINFSVGKLCSIDICEEAICSAFKTERIKEWMQASCLWVCRPSKIILPFKTQNSQQIDESALSAKLHYLWNNVIYMRVCMRAEVNKHSSACALWKASFYI